jgi:hypothetical protein
MPHTLLGKQTAGKQFYSHDTLQRWLSLHNNIVGKHSVQNEHSCSKSVVRPATCSMTSYLLKEVRLINSKLNRTIKEIGCLTQQGGISEVTPKVKTRQLKPFVTEYTSSLLWALCEFKMWLHVTLETTVTMLTKQAWHRSNCFIKTTTVPTEPPVQVIIKGSSVLTVWRIWTTVLRKRMRCVPSG